MKKALLFLLLAGAAQAETLFEYGRQCAEQVTEIPAFNCMAGEEIPITARRVVTFHASQKLKAMVDSHYHGREPEQQQQG